MASSAAPLATRTCSTIVHTLIIVSISLLLCTDTTSPAVQFHNALTSTILDEIFTNYISQFIDFTKNLGDLRNYFLSSSKKDIKLSISISLRTEVIRVTSTKVGIILTVSLCRCHNVHSLTYVRWFARSVCTNVIDIDGTSFHAILIWKQ